MNTAELIEEIERLTPLQRAEVARALNRPLTADELEALARRMVQASDPDEAQALEDELVRGFYGGQPHA
jgi:acetyl-CoA carboxylase alpha subunit